MEIRDEMQKFTDEIYNTDLDVIMQYADDFVKEQIRLAEESLAGRIRGKIQKAIDKLPSELSMMQGGSYVTLDSILDWEELQIPKPKGDK